MKKKFHYQRNSKKNNSLRIATKCQDPKMEAEKILDFYLTLYGEETIRELRKRLLRYFEQIEVREDVKSEIKRYFEYGIENTKARLVFGPR